eukprot:841136-Alexandrium_andersonii.AAC.1
MDARGSPNCPAKRLSKRRAMESKIRALPGSAASAGPIVRSIRHRGSTRHSSRTRQSAERRSVTKASRAA